jgi:uncharacterized protein YhbP (UPF0306 family)
MSAELTERIAAFLKRHQVLSLATAGAAGPHAANLFYACDGLALVWVSDVNARHSRELEADPRVAATIAPQYSDFLSIQGLQVAGKAGRIADHDRARHLALLEARFPFLKQLADAPPELREAYARIAVYRLEPAHIVLIDNTKGFGHKERLDLSPPQT